MHILRWLHYFIVHIASELPFSMGIILMTSLTCAFYVTDQNDYQLVLAFQHVLSKYFAIVRPCKHTRLVTELVIVKFSRFVINVLMSYRDAIIDKLIRLEYTRTTIL